MRFCLATPYGDRLYMNSALTENFLRQGSTSEKLGAVQRLAGAAEVRRTAAEGGGSSAEVARLNRTKQTNSFAHKPRGRRTAEQ